MKLMVEADAASGGGAAAAWSRVRIPAAVTHDASLPAVLGCRLRRAFAVPTSTPSSIEAAISALAIFDAPARSPA